jgi:transcriptional regulator of met regulon
LDPSLETVQHSKPAEDGKHLTTSLYVKVIKLLTKILCALLLMAGQNHL